jgi:hypothetical protein
MTPTPRLPRRAARRPTGFGPLRPANNGLWALAVSAVAAPLGGFKQRAGPGMRSGAILGAYRAFRVLQALSPGRWFLSLTVPCNINPTEQGAIQKGRGPRQTRPRERDNKDVDGNAGQSFR